MKRIKTYNGLKYSLNKEINRGRLLDTNRISRGIGKSKLLKEMAINNGYFIITGTQKLANLFNKNLEKELYISAGSINSLRGERFNGLLLEEGIKLEDEKEIRRLFNVIGGYSSNFRKEKGK